MNDEVYNCAIYDTKHSTYTLIKQSSIDHEFIDKIIMFDINTPIFIELFDDLNLLFELIFKFNRKANNNLKYINFEENLKVDGIYKITNDFVFLNYNALAYNDNDKLTHENLKIFYFKNFVVSFQTRPKNMSLIADILINKINFIRKSNDEFFTLGRSYLKSINKASRIFDIEEEELFDNLSQNENESLDEEYMETINLYFYNSDYDKKSKYNSVFKILEEEEEKIAKLKRKNKQSKFSFLQLYFNLFTNSLDELKKIIDCIINESERMKDEYLDLNSQERKLLYIKVLDYMDKIINLLNEIKIKYDFFESISIDSIDKNIPILKLFMLNKSSNRFNEHLKLVVKSLKGKLIEMEVRLKNEISVLDMINKTIKILSDDDKYSRDKQLNFIVLILTVANLIYAPCTILNGIFSMNIKIPVQHVDSNFFFPGVIFVMLIMAFVKFVILKKNMNLIYRI